MTESTDRAPVPPPAGDSEERLDTDRTADAQALARPEPAAWEALQDVLQLARGTLGTVLRAETGLSRPRFEALARLHAAPEGLTMGALARELRVSNGNVTALVDALESEGWVARHAEGDRRKVRVALSDPARQAFAALQGPYDATVAGLFGGLSQLETRLLLGLLNKLRAHLRREREAREPGAPSRPPRATPHSGGPGWGWV